MGLILIRTAHTMVLAPRIHRTLQQMAIRRATTRPILFQVTEVVRNVDMEMPLVGHATITQRVKLLQLYRASVRLYLFL